MRTRPPIRTPASISRLVRDSGSYAFRPARCRSANRRYVSATPSASEVRGSGPNRASSRAVVEVGGDRQLAVAVGDHAPRFGHGRLEGRDERLDRHDRAPDVERLGPLERVAQGPEEGGGHVADVLQVLEPAVADGEGPAGGDRLDRLGRLAGHAEVAADAVDGPGPEADAGDPLVEPVDPGVQLVADLERAVVGQRGEPDLVADGLAPASAGPWTAAELA